MLYLCYNYVISMLYLCYIYVISMLYLCYNYVISMLHYFVLFVLFLFFFYILSKHAKSDLLKSCKHSHAERFCLNNKYTCRLYNMRNTNGTSNSRGN